MTTSHGIYEFTGNEQGAPGPDFFAPLTDSIEAAFANVDQQIAEIGSEVDSGWVPITTFSAGWTATPGHPPRVRKDGDYVTLWGALTRSGSTGGASLLTIPEGFRLGGAYVGTVFVGSVVQNNGNAINLTVQGAGGGHLLQAAYGQIGASVVMPLMGGWYVN